MLWVLKNTMKGKWLMVPVLESYQQNIFKALLWPRQSYLKPVQTIVKLWENFVWPLMKQAHGFYIRKGKSLEGIKSQDWARLHAGKFWNLWLLSSPAYACWCHFKTWEYLPMLFHASSTRCRHKMQSILKNLKIVYALFFFFTVEVELEVLNQECKCIAV